MTCSPPCLTCAYGPNNCTSCDTQSANAYLFENKCLSTCPPTYYDDVSTHTCLNCTSPCYTCTDGSTSSCISCIPLHYLINSTCLVQCPSTYYPSLYTCLPCVSLCVTCLSELQCTSCVTGKYLYGYSCVGACNPGMTVSVINNISTCILCDSSCRTCITPSYCTSCYTSTYLYNGTCIPSCPSTTYYYLNSSSSV